MINLNERAYTCVVEQNDYSKIDKIIVELNSGDINKFNFFDHISLKFINKSKSQHEKDRWACLSENVYRNISWEEQL